MASPDPQRRPVDGRRNDDSWVEIASQPSSSSLSSIGDEIVTTGLRVGNNSYPRRRRRSQQHAPMPASFIVSQPNPPAGTSSQDEYDETESEEDRVMTSSTEGVHPAASLPRQQTAFRGGLPVDSEEESDDDENATALGRPTNTAQGSFRPQPNAFSHPPSYMMHRHHSASPSHPYHPTQSRPTLPTRSQTRSHRASHNFLSPALQADNDAALRASLTTLLSCAAAARGLPKREEASPGPAGTGVMPSSQPMEFRLVPESELMAEGPSGAGGLPLNQAKSRQPARTASNSSAPSAPRSASSGREQQPQQGLVTAERSKRGTNTAQRPARTTKKRRTSSPSPAGALSDNDAGSSFFLSPTVLTWVVSAGVVVLVSVVGFGAGYVIGREVGRQESSGALSLASAGSAASNASSSCGQEFVRSTTSGTLKRFRWGSVGRSVVA
ncbi:hypothetical protein B0T20DRAFT_232100 [Sordaria brevicollis]|uniref:Uncharacterized protein n=1 Tax=Sordaria brevicollis TaxID=83679 RepID=A0AAE0PD81_SORBR|nr:hypothetical protein B0T20DRAFT_232100 [Sordaria brevicollis]